MAPFDQFPQFLFPSQAFRPVHMTLTEPHPGLRSIARTIEDPFYHNPNHHHHEVTFSPSFDVRESDFAFFLEGEFPGVERKEDITIEKLGPRTLLVESNLARFDVEAEWGRQTLAPPNTILNGMAEQKHAHMGANEGIIRVSNEGGGKRENPRWEQQGVQLNADNLYVRLAERRVGYLQRSFTFPSPVDIDALRARLRCGLLVMMVPKATDGKHDSRKINIED